MTPLHVADLKTIATRYWAHLGLLIMLFLYFGCDGNSQKIADLNAKVAQSESTVKIYEDQNAALQDTLKAKEAKIAELDQKSDGLQREKEKIKADGKKKLSKLKKYTPEGYAKWFRERYAGYGAVSQNGSALTLTDSIPAKIAIDLIEGENTKGELAVSEEQLDNEISKSEVKDQLISTLKQEKANTHIILGAKDDINAYYKGLVQEQEKTIKKNTRAKNVLKTGILAGLAAGIVTGILIAN